MGTACSSVVGRASNKPAPRYQRPVIESIVSVHKYVVMLHLPSCLFLTVLWLLSSFIYIAKNRSCHRKARKKSHSPTLSIAHAVKDLFIQLWKRACICILNGIKKIPNICCKQN